MQRLYGIVRLRNYLEEIAAAPVKKTENMTGGIRCADQAWLAGALGYIARKQTTKKTLPPISLLLYDVITGKDPKEVTHCCIAYCVFIRCHSNGSQHMPYCLQHTHHNML
jgi:hypothetical protein